MNTEGIQRMGSHRAILGMKLFAWILTVLFVATGFLISVVYTSSSVIQTQTALESAAEELRAQAARQVEIIEFIKLS